MPIRKKQNTLNEKIDLSEAGGGNEFIYVEKSVTKNMGDYNSAKVTVGVQVHLNPTNAKLQQIAKTIDVATEIVDTRIEEEVEKLLSDESGY